MGVLDATSATAGDALEILSVALLDEQRATVNEIRHLAGELGIGLGWHYLLDLAWILARLGKPPETVLDAGAGTGIIQWYLADRGARVISVDRAPRRNLPSRFRKRFRVRGLRPLDLAPLPSAPEALVRAAVRTGRRLPAALVALRHGYRGRSPAPAPSPRASRGAAIGEVIVYDQDLRDLADIETDSIDAIVSVSSLEHNTPENLEAVVAELLRVLRPGGRLIATLGASGGADWYHEPSQGWCYSEATLRRVFGLSDEVTSNYARFDELLGELRANAELRDNLAAFYFSSGANGMPWGKWDPTYQSVGVCKAKV